MKSRMIAKTGKRIITIMLSLIMVVGVFAGVKLDVKAERKDVTSLKPGDTLHAGDEIYPPEEGYFGPVYCYFKGQANIATTRGESSPTKGRPYTILKFEVKNYLYDTYEVIKVENQNGLWSLDVYLIPRETQPEETPEETTGETTSNKLPINEEVPNHICNFQWVTTIDPTTGADGLEEYKCAGCGLVKESHPIPASVAAVKDFYGNIKDAPKNGSITYDSGKLYTISDYLLKKMSERSDMAVTVKFEYQNAKYELTFTAGIDFTPVLTDEDTMYGYFGVAAKLGLTVTAK